MMLKIEKNENKFILRFWLAYVCAGLFAMMVLLVSGTYKSVCLSGLPMTASLFYIVFSALVCYVFVFMIWLTLIYYRVVHGIEYIGIRYFWPLYACMLFGLGYSAFFLKYVNVYPGTSYSHFTLTQFLAYIQKHHCAAASFLFEDFPLLLLMIVMMLALPVIYYVFMRLEGKIATENMNTRGTVIKSRQKLANKYVKQFYFHVLFITVLILLVYFLHYLIFILLR